MKHNHEFDPALCPVRTILAKIGDKWSILLMHELRSGQKRFSELARALPDISQRMLTSTLRKLERDGLVSRHVTPSIPPRVDYKLTSLGHSLLTPLDGLSAWASVHRSQILKARAAYDRAK